MENKNKPKKNEKAKPKCLASTISFINEYFRRPLPKFGFPFQDLFIVRCMYGKERAKLQDGP